MSDDQGASWAMGINVGLGSHDPGAVPRLPRITGVGWLVTPGTLEKGTRVTVLLNLCHVRRWPLS